MTGRPEFSVAVFYHDGTHRYLERWVTAEQAIRQMDAGIFASEQHPGVAKRIVITDGGDCINVEWQEGLGFTFPPHWVQRPPGVTLQ